MKNFIFTEVKMKSENENKSENESENAFIFTRAPNPF
jgi:hypothetical protein